MFIESILVDSSTNLEDLKNIIECKIYDISSRELESIRFGIKSVTNYDLVDDLEDYLDITNDKLYGCNCLGNLSIDTIYSRVIKLTNSTC